MNMVEWLKIGVGFGAILCFYLGVWKAVELTISLYSYLELP